jgi:hypothetical protein
MEHTATTDGVFVVTRARAAILQKVGDIMLTTEEAAAYTGYSMEYLRKHMEIPRTTPPIRFRLSDLDRILDARMINPLPRSA